MSVHRCLLSAQNRNEKTFPLPTLPLPVVPGGESWALTSLPYLTRLRDVVLLPHGGPVAGPDGDRHRRRGAISSRPQIPTLSLALSLPRWIAAISMPPVMYACALEGECVCFL